MDLDFEQSTGLWHHVLSENLTTEELARLMMQPEDVRTLLCDRSTLEKFARVGIS